jgi:energy-coupling factor transporter transmembrane protein EcfT
MIDVLAIDRWSTQRTSWLHRASAPAKLLAVGALITLLVFSQSPAGLALVCVALVAVLLSSRLPVVPLLGLAMAPVLMSALFALTRLGGPWGSALVVVEKGIITSLSILLLVASTPRTDLFRLLRRVMPRALADMVVLAYGSIFVLLTRALEARTALRLRGGPAPWPTRLRRSAVIGALTMLRAVELAEEQYAVMRLRGYPGPARARELAWRPAVDVPLLGGLTIVLALSLGLAATAGAPGAALVAWMQP